MNFTLWPRAQEILEAVPRGSALDARLVEQFGAREVPSYKRACAQLMAMSEEVTQVECKPEWLPRVVRKLADYLDEPDVELEVALSAEQDVGDMKNHYLESVVRLHLSWALSASAYALIKRLNRALGKEQLKGFDLSSLDVVVSYLESHGYYNYGHVKRVHLNHFLERERRLQEVRSV